MIPLAITLDGRVPGAVPEAADGLTDGTIVRVVAMPDGTERGKPAIGLIIRLPDGSHVGAWTTLNLFLVAARAIEGRYGPPAD